MTKNILLVLTSNNKLGDTGQQSGWYLPEVAHPYYVFKDAGYKVTISSIQGGAAPCDEESIIAYKEDAQCSNFLESEETRNLIENTVPIANVNPVEYDAVFFAGGFGVMWDFPDNVDLQRTAAAIYERNGIVSGVCHGPIALANVKLSDGSFLVDNKKLTAFTNDEEDSVKRRQVVPYTCEDRLREQGAMFQKSGVFKEHTVVDGRLITGQNPQSAKPTAEAVCNALNVQEKVLLVLTSNDRLGDSGQKTGWYLPEVVHPYYIFKAEGFSVKLASILGGAPPMDPEGFESFKEDRECKEFLSSSYTKGLVEETSPVSSVDPKDFNAVFFAGGHGVMWDFPDDKNVQDIVKGIYENGGIVAAVCHGPIAFANVKLSDGRYLVKDKHLTAFTNEEEDVVKRREIVPFTCEDKLTERGAIFEKSPAFECKVCVDDRVITGQNPQSAKDAPKRLVQALGKRSSIPDGHT